MSTETASFGAGKREGHDARRFYSRRMLRPAPEARPGPPVAPPAEVLDRLFCRSSESMEELPDDCVALMVTSPPYNVGKDYDVDLSLEEYLGLLKRVLSETYRVLEPGGRVAVNVANLGRRPYLALNHRVAALLEDLGFLLRGEIVWQKAQGAGGSCAWGSWCSARNPTLRDVHEYIVVASKGSFRRLRLGEDTISRQEFLEATVSVWNIAPASARRIGHPGPVPRRAAPAADRAVLLPGRPGARPVHGVGLHGGGRGGERPALRGLRDRARLPGDRPRPGGGGAGPVPA